MRLAYLSAGAGGMYCGSCLRDNALAAALLRQGRDVVLIPLYTPLRTDTAAVSENRVFYGGLSIYLRDRFALFRALPPVLTRPLDSPHLLRRLLRNVGGGPPAELGRLTVSVLLGEHGSQRRELDRLVSALSALRPDVVHLPNALFVGLAAPLKRRLGAAVACTLTGEASFIDRLSDRWRDEVTRLIADRAPDVDAFLAVTRYYGDHAAARFAIPHDRIHDVPLGVWTGDDEPAPAPPAVFTIGYLARICPEKGLHVLCDAFARLRSAGRECRLRVAGYLGRGDRPWWESLQAQARREGLSPFIDYLGELDRPGKLAMLRSLHAFSVPAVYAEAKGLYVLEALAQGVPVVQPAHGSFPELIAATGGGLLCRPGDATDLAARLAQLMDDADLRRRLGSAGRAAVRESFSEDHMARRAWEVFASLAGRAGRIRDP